jgi:hypothetical protein
MKEYIVLVLDKFYQGEKALACLLQIFLDISLHFHNNY